MLDFRTHGNCIRNTIFLYTNLYSDFDSLYLDNLVHWLRELDRCPLVLVDRMLSSLLSSEAPCQSLLSFSLISVLISIERERGFSGTWGCPPKHFISQSSLVLGVATWLILGQQEMNRSDATTFESCPHKESSGPIFPFPFFSLAEMQMLQWTTGKQTRKSLYT